MKHVFLLAHPAKHSLSAPMHNAAFEALGIEADYEALDVAPENLAKTVESLRQSHCYGANVTVPHKLAVLPLMDELSDAAKAIGAVNTIINQKSRLLGHNTDATGYLRALQEDAQFELKAKNVLILGAGGAARAIAYAVLQAGAKQLGIYNRSQEKAVSLVQDFSYLGNIEVVSDIANAVKNVDLLINTSSVGMEHNGIDPNESPLAPEFLPDNGFVSDIVYRPERTRLLRDAAAKGLATQNGLAMLIYQGAESFTCWTGEKAPIAIMFEAAQKALRKF